MALCAYCDRECVPTSEHVVPDWYGNGSAKEGWEVFNARKPLTHRNGPLKIRDVCSSCNNVALSKLDTYGKSVYRDYLQTALCFGESIDIAFDASLLRRWLVKLVYNSARVHNADARILRKYRRFALGVDATPQPVVYVDLISPTNFATNPPSPAARSDMGDDALPVRWFRFVQYRVNGAPYSEIVQRQIYIDAFCFTLFATDPESADHERELGTLVSLFKQNFPSALLLDNDPLCLTAGAIHAALTMAPHMENHPSRYGEGPTSRDAEFAQVLTALAHDKCKFLGLALTREEAESGNIAYLIQSLTELVATRESLQSAMQRVAIFADGYDDDERELWDIPEVRRSLKQVYKACPYLFLLLHPESETLELFMACCCEFTRGDDGTLFLDKEQLRGFVNFGFNGMNQVCLRLAISDERNREITDFVCACVEGLHRPKFRDA